MKKQHSFLFFLTTFILLGIYGCNPYQRISIGSGNFYGRNVVVDRIDRYDVYVHQNDSVYVLTDPQNKDSIITGTSLIAVDSVTIEEMGTLDTMVKLKPDEKNDVHIYLDKDERKPTGKKTTIQLHEDEIDEVKIGARKKIGALGIFFIIIGVVLGVLFLGILIIVLALVSNGSNSGGSDSGGSDSDSGGSDSGCYIATMAYGSYEAPQVMVLRRFRDRFLSRFAVGRNFIQWYYRNSPGFVRKHQSKNWLHNLLRSFLNILVYILYPFFRK